MKKKMFTFALGLFAAATIFTSCGNNSKQETTDNKTEEKVSEKITLGMIGPLTGDAAVYGITSLNGMELAVEEINANGGILGKEITLLKEDDQADPAKGKLAYKKVKSSNVDMIIGPITSGSGEVVAKDANQDKIPMITPTGTALSLTNDREYVFRTCYTDPFQGEVLAKYAAENLQAKKVAVLSSTSSDYSAGVAKAFEEKAKEFGMEVVAFEKYNGNDKDFKAQLTKIKEANPDVLCIPDYYNVIALVAKQAREVGIKATLVGPDGWDGVLKQMEADSQAVEGSVFANHYSQDDQSEKVQNFIKAYKDKFKEDPTAFSALSYDTIYMVKSAVEKAGKVDSEAIKEALETISSDGVTGSLTFDENHNPIKAVSMIKIENGKYVFDTIVKND